MILHSNDTRGFSVCAKEHVLNTSGRLFFSANPHQKGIYISQSANFESFFLVHSGFCGWRALVNGTAKPTIIGGHRSLGSAHRTAAIFAWAEAAQSMPIEYFFLLFHLVVLVVACWKETNERLWMERKEVASLRPTMIEKQFSSRAADRTNSARLIYKLFFSLSPR